MSKLISAERVCEIARASFEHGRSESGANAPRPQNGFVYAHYAHAIGILRNSELVNYISKEYPGSEADLEYYLTAYERGRFGGHPDE